VRGAAAHGDRPPGQVLTGLGLQVTEINVTQQLQLLEVRGVLERLIAESAARRATSE